MFEIAVLIAAVAATVGAWVRRYTWSSRLEQPMTMSTALFAVGLFLISPQVVPILGAPLHAVSGVWHLDTCAGDICLILAAATGLCGILAHMGNDAQTQAWANRWVNPVINAAIPAMVIAIAASDAVDSGEPNILDIACDTWLSVYWIVTCATLAWLWLLALRALAIARRHVASRRTANLYSAMTMCGIAACVLQSGVALGLPIDGQTPVAVLFCTACAGTTVVSAHSWRAKARALRCVGHCVCNTPTHDPRRTHHG